MLCNEDAFFASWIHFMRFSFEINGCLRPDSFCKLSYLAEKHKHSLCQTVIASRLQADNTLNSKCYHIHSHSLVHAPRSAKRSQISKNPGSNVKNRNLFRLSWKLCLILNKSAKSHKSKLIQPYKASNRLAVQSILIREIDCLEKQFNMFLFRIIERQICDNVIKFDQMHTFA